MAFLRRVLAHNVPTEIRKLTAEKRESKGKQSLETGIRRIGATC